MENICLSTLRSDAGTVVMSFLSNTDIVSLSLTCKEMARKCESERQIRFANVQRLNGAYTKCARKSVMKERLSLFVIFDSFLSGRIIWKQSSSYAGGAGATESVSLHLFKFRVSKTANTGNRTLSQPEQQQSDSLPSFCFVEGIGNRSVQVKSSFGVGFGNGNGTFSNEADNMYCSLLFSADAKSCMFSTGVFMSSLYERADTQAVANVTKIVMMQISQFEETFAKGLADRKKASAVFDE